jgi:hypothetical protein
MRLLAAIYFFSPPTVKTKVIYCYPLRLREARNLFSVTFPMFQYICNRYSQNLQNLYEVGEQLFDYAYFIPEKGNKG